jgi:hypothetical protein
MPELETERTETIVAGGSMVESVAAVGAVVVTILGILGILRPILGPIGTIAIGAALLAEGGVFGAPFIARRTVAGGTSMHRGLGGAAGVTTFGGAVGIALGVLALLRVQPLTLQAVAVIVFGASLLLSGAGASAIAKLATRASAEFSASDIMRETADTVSGTQALVGLGAATLGILALLGFAPQLLVLIALLSVAGALLMTGVAMASAMTYVRQH